MREEKPEEIASAQYLYWDDEMEVFVGWHGGPQFTYYNKDLEDCGNFTVNASDLPPREHTGHKSVRAHLDSVIERKLEGLREELLPDEY